jgi:guanine deaminase
VIVCDGTIACTGQDVSATTHDPTDHAEVAAIRALIAAGQHESLSRATLYASCEPCAMCSAALARCPLPRVYFGALREEAAAAGFADIVPPSTARELLRSTGKIVEHLPVDDALDVFQINPAA